MTSPTNRTPSYHERRLARQLEDPEYREEFERASREIEAIDKVVNALEGLRGERGISKAELAREIGKNPASVRRMLTTSGNPELRTVVAMAEALDADVQIVPRRRGPRPRPADYVPPTAIGKPGVGKRKVSA
jgi:DNA-binding phage protein